MSELDRASAGSNRVTPGEAAIAGSGADHKNAGAERLSSPPGQDLRWTDGEGTEAVLSGDRLSIYGKPSMTSDNGDVAIGVDIPEWILRRWGVA